MPELRDCHCSKTDSMVIPRSRAWSYKRTVLTKIVLDHIGIVEIDHAGEQLMEWRRRKWGWKMTLRKQALHKYIDIYALSRTIRPPTTIVVVVVVAVDEAVTPLVRALRRCDWGNVDHLLAPTGQPLIAP